jgi:hypothetical protein
LLHPREPNAHVDAIPGGTEIHICPTFYSLSPTYQSRTLIHEGLHLINIRHGDFTDPDTGEPAATGGPMNDAIMSSCFEH